MIFFTSDLHFGHENILKLCSRPFAGIDAMNEALIERWNERVSGNDTVYILGDLFFRSENIEPVLKRLRGKKHLILGNHESSWYSPERFGRFFVDVAPMAEISDGKRGMTLCHYPMLAWKHDARQFMIHGHIHNDTRADYWNWLKSRERILNASVDINDFRPVSFDELQENNIRWKSTH